MKHLLVIRFSALGDVAIGVPVVDALARQYPDLRITVVSKPHMAPLFEALPPNVDFHPADVRRRHKGLLGLRRLARELLAEGIDAVADLHDVLRSRVLCFFFFNHGLLCSVIDKGRSAKRQLTRGQLRRPLPTAAERYLRVFRHLGLDVAPPHAPLAYPGGERVLSLVGAKQAGELWLGVAPFAAHPGKIYPVLRMHDALTLFLARHPGARIFVFGSREEMKAIRAPWSEDFPRLLFATDVLHGLGDELRLMQYLDAMVSMDSANMHLASLVGTPVLSIWGQTHPWAGFTGYGQPPDRSVQLDLPCRPCSVYGNKPCRYSDYRCLTRISPQLVADRLEALLAEPSDAERPDKTANGAPRAANKR